VKRYVWPRLCAVSVTAAAAAELRLRGAAAARCYTPALALVPVIMRCYAAAGSFLYFGNNAFYRCGA